MRSIRSIIFFNLFWILIVFFSIVAGTAYCLTNNALMQFAVADTTRSLTFVISNIRTNYTNDLRALDDIARMEGFVPFARQEAQRIIKEFLQFQNVFSTIHMYRKEGDLIFAEQRAGVPEYVIEASFRQKNKRYIALVESVLAQKLPLASETFYTPSGKLYQTYVTPVFADKEKRTVFGVLSGAVFPRWQSLDKLLKGLKLGKDNFILVTDHAGRLIASDGISPQAVYQSIKPHTDQATARFFSAGRETRPAPSNQLAVVGKRTMVGSSSYIVTSLPIPELKLVVTLGVSRKLIERKESELSHRLLVAAVLGLFLSLFASIIVGERLAKPFRSMVSTMTKINAGDLSARIPYDKEDEIGSLSGLVNTVAGKIAKSEQLRSLWNAGAKRDEDE